MNREVISFKVAKVPHRGHQALFDDDLPFKGRTEKSKKVQYNRKPKHKNKAWDI